MPTLHGLTPHVFHSLAALGSAKVLNQTPENASVVSAKLVALEDPDATDSEMVAAAVAYFAPLVTGLGNLRAASPPAPATSTPDSE